MATHVIDRLITILGFQETGATAVKRYQGRISTLQGTMGALRTGAATLQSSITGAATASAAGILLMGRNLLKYEQAQNALKATFVDATTAQRDELETQARDIGATTSRMTSDVVRAQVAIARAGFSAQETLATTAAAVNLAIAGEIDVEQAAGLVTKTIRGFNLEATESTRVVDALSRVSQEASTNIPELEGALRPVQAYAGAAGVELEQLLAIIGWLRTGGLAPEMAGVAARNIMAQLLRSPTARQEDALAEVGLTHLQLKNKLMGGDLIGVFEDIAQSGLGVGGLLDVFNVRGAPASAILTTHIKGLRDLEASLLSAGGNAEKMRQTMEEGLPGAWYKMKSAADEAILSIGESGLTQALTDVLTQLRSFFTWVRNADDSTKEWIMRVIKAAAWLVIIRIALGVLTFTTGVATFAIKLFTGAWTLLGLTLKGVRAALALFAGTQKAATVGTAAYSTSLLWLRIQLIALAVWTKISTAAQVAWNWAMGVGRAIAGSAAVAWIAAKGGSDCLHDCDLGGYRRAVGPQRCVMGEPCAADRGRHHPAGRGVGRGCVFHLEVPRRYRELLQGPRSVVSQLRDVVSEHRQKHSRLGIQRRAGTLCWRSSRA